MEEKSRSETGVDEELGRIVSKNDQERRNKKAGGGEKKSLIVKRKEINATEQKWLPETTCRDARLLVSIFVLLSDIMITVSRLRLGAHKRRDTIEFERIIQHLFVMRS